METELSFLVAKIIGVTYTAMSIGVLAGSISYKQMFQEIEKTPAVNYAFGLFGLVIGFLLIEYHNIWVWDWPVVVTLIGWIGVVKGVSLMVLPDYTKWFKPMFTGKFANVLPYLTLIFGLIFVYIGFFA